MKVQVKTIIQNAADAKTIYVHSHYNGSQIQVDKANYMAMLQRHAANDNVSFDIPEYYYDAINNVLYA